MSKSTINVGVIGCGNISIVYLTNLTQHYQNVNVVACADLLSEKASQAAQTYGVPKNCTVEELLADPEVELIVNLTLPAVHCQVNRQALEAGKHVYCEKPLALSLEDADGLVKLAESRGLLLASAPDTILGAGLMTCRNLLDSGAVGKVTTFTANVVNHGSELWHPSPKFLYQKGAGPVLDVGPYYVSALVSLLGPIKQIFCTARTPEPIRNIQGEAFPVEVSTTYSSVVEFCNGAVGNINASFDAWRSQLPCIEIHGTKASLYAPDPNMFKGPVGFYDGKALEARITGCNGTFTDKLNLLYGPESDKFLREEPLHYPTDLSEQANMRGMGVSDMADALLRGRQPRLTASFARHIVEALCAFQISSDRNEPYVMTTTCDRPNPMTTGLPLWTVG